MSLFTRYNTTVPEDDMLRPILEVAEELGLECIPTGTMWYGALCPVHNDTNPSLRINESGYFLCHACQQGGGAAHLYKFITGCTMEQAIAATVRADADALDMLDARSGSGGDAGEQQSIVALQIMLAQRVLNDEDPPVEEWCAAMAEAKDDAELLARLRAIK